jgi:hypothetical protein
MISTVGQLFDEIDRHFLSVPKLHYVSIFTQSEKQVEGWFKGELLYLFAALQQQGQLAHWDCEVTLPSLGKKRIDFLVTLDGMPLYLEVKTLYHGLQRGTPIDLGLYFYKDDVGIWPDIQKLAVVAEGLRYCLLFVYPAPAPQRWQQRMNTYAQKIAPITLREASNLAQYPPALYIAKLEVS